MNDYKTRFRERFDSQFQFAVLAKNEEFCRLLNEYAFTPDDLKEFALAFIDEVVAEARADEAENCSRHVEAAVLKERTALIEKVEGMKLPLVPHEDESEVIRKHVHNKALDDLLTHLRANPSDV